MISDGGRHPAMELAALRSAEPEPLPDKLPEPTAEAKEGHPALVAEAMAAFHVELESRAGVLVPHEDPDYEPEGEGGPTSADRTVTRCCNRRGRSCPPRAGTSSVRPGSRRRTSSAAWRMLADERAHIGTGGDRMPPTPARRTD
jgi:hypothetical protein